MAQSVNFAPRLEKSEPDFLETIKALIKIITPVCISCGGIHGLFR